MHPIAKILQQTQFLTSAPTPQLAPPDTGFEVAFAGRSNAGKSSALNRLTSQRNLARTSKTPGRTQLLNFFSVDEERRLVDLPGYGYAKVGQQMRQSWQKNIDGYLSKRECLRGIILLTDVRHPLKEFDLMMIDWATQSQVALHILLTKADKLSFGAAKSALHKAQSPLLNNPFITLQLFSATSGLGTDEAWDLIGNWLGLDELLAEEA